MLMEHLFSKQDLPLTEKYIEHLFQPKYYVGFNEMWNKGGEKITPIFYIHLPFKIALGQGAVALCVCAHANV